MKFSAHYRSEQGWLLYSCSRSHLNESILLRLTVTGTSYNSPVLQITCCFLIVSRIEDPNPPIQFIIKVSKTCRYIFVCRLPSSVASQTHSLHLDFTSTWIWFFHIFFSLYFHICMEVGGWKANFVFIFGPILMARIGCEL